MMQPTPLREQDQARIAAGAPLSAADRAVVQQALDAVASEVSALARALWEQPELGYQEVRSSAAMASLLETHGFSVDRGVAGIPTAFVARFRAAAGDGPRIGFLAEMDALPGFSQDDSPRRSPIPGQEVGHACGHHLFGAAAIGAGIALARWLDQSGTPGEVIVFGTPAEEGGAGKAFMARAGIFDGLDLALHWHPDDCNTVWQSRSLASIGARVRFHGRTAHAAVAPERGRSALHAVEAFHHMASLMREVVPPQTQIHYVVTRGGVAPNVIPDLAESQVNVRHPDARIAQEVFARLELAARGAAMGTGTEAEVERQGGVHSILPNDTVGRVMLANMREDRPIRWTAEERAWAETLQQEMEAPEDLSRVTGMDPYRFGQTGAFSSDVGDVSWLAPCGALGTATWVPGTRPHSWQAVAAGGMSIGMKGMLAAAESLATTAANFLARPELLVLARAEFEAARGPDFRYEPLVGDQPVPFGYREG